MLNDKIVTFEEIIEKSKYSVSFNSKTHVAFSLVFQ
jgi:hypothetical protein